MRFSTQSWDPSLFVPVKIHTEKFFAHSSLKEHKKLQIEAFNDPSKLMKGEIDTESFEICTYINGKVTRFRPTTSGLSVTFNCPIDTQSSSDCIRASVQWRSQDNKNYKAQMMTEIPITEIVNGVALGLHQLQEKHWTNCFALNKLKAIHILFDRALKEDNKMGKFKIESLKDLEIEPLNPLPNIKKEDGKPNSNLILSSLVNATYMQQHPQEYLYVRTCYQNAPSNKSLDLKNKSIIKHPNGAKVTQYL